MVEELLELEDTSTEVVDFVVMAPPKPKKPTDPPSEPGPYNPSRHGTWAQWAAFVAAMLSLGLTLWYHFAASAATASDEHIGTIVDSKLNPAVKGINDNISKQLEPITKKLDEVASKVDDAQGQLKRLRGDVDEQGQKQKQQLAVARIYDPARILATIRAEIELAQERGKVLPASEVNDYRDAVQALPASAYEYWTTVAAIINYQSLLNQMSGEAPDPAKVAKPCYGENARHNVFFGGILHNCMVVLDTEAFNHVTFQDSVIIYHGGPVSLNAITFVNCRFVVDFPPQHELPADKSLVLALLASPDQKSIHVSK